MNRRQLIATGASAVCGLLVPSVALSRPKYETLPKYLNRVAPNVMPSYILELRCLRDGHRWLTCVYKWGVDLTDWKRLMRRSEWWMVTEKGPHRIDPITLELIPFTPKHQTV